MNTEQFLTHVLPTTGPYIVAHDHKFQQNGKTISSYRQFTARNIHAATSIALLLEREQRNVFFAIGACKEAQVWDAAKKRKVISRKGSNIRGLRSYVMDIDAGFKDGKQRQYPTVPDALAALQEFVKVTGLPRPTITTSGFGLHVYWTLTDEVPEAEWEQNGKLLSALATKQQFNIDHARTIDSSSVLRVVGTTNRKYANNPKVECIYEGKPTDPLLLMPLLLGTPIATALIAHAPTVDFGNNVNKYERDTLDFKEMAINCQLLQHVADKNNQAQGRAAITEPMWRGGLMLAGHCRDGRKVAHFISKHDPRYSADTVDQKYDVLLKNDIGPITCVKWEKEFEHGGHPDACNGCRFKGKIQSPAQVGKYIERAPPLVVPIELASGTVTQRIIPDPPDPYVRTTKGIAIKVDNPSTGAPGTILFCPYDMYPARLRYDEVTRLEDDVLWKVNLPGEGWVDVSIPHMSKNQIQTALAKRGMYISEFHIPHQVNFMSAYMRKLQNTMPREVAYSKCGWTPNHNGFVLGNTLYKKDGSKEDHAVSNALQSATQGGMTTAGDVNKWRTYISMYARPGNPHCRTYIYMAFGSMFYHMTGQIATCVSASGVTGTGKSTLMEACASIWGDPARLKVRGSKDGSTRAAAEVLADGMHHLPVFMDEITGRDAKDVADLIFNYSGGKGKIRSTVVGGIRGDTATWSNLLLVNANSDEYERMASVFRDSSQHLMRLIQIDFTPNDSISKMEGDVIKRGVHENYGWAGHLFVEWCVQHHDQIKKRLLHLIEEIDKEVGAKSEERFWTAGIACAQLGAEIASALGLLPNFPLTADFKWMREQVPLLRQRTSHQMPNADELMAEFLDLNIGSTLTIGAKGAGNIDNILHEPNREIAVRYEVDNHVCYVARHVFRQYCIEHGLNFVRATIDMHKKGVLLRDNTLKVLGAGTQFGKGQVRCMEVDVTALGGTPQVVAAATPAVVATPARPAGKRP